MKIVLSTNNRRKAEEIAALFAGTSTQVVTLADAGIVGAGEEKRGAPLRDNARAKALFAHEKLSPKLWTMADDTGLFISALNGEPGSDAAIWAGDKATVEENLNHCLQRMRGVQNRAAIFRTTIVLISPDWIEYEFTGEVDGHLLEEPRVAPLPGMPYSCLFVPDGYKQCWAEMTVEQENKISHRAKAFRQMQKLVERLR